MSKPSFKSKKLTLESLSPEEIEVPIQETETFEEFCKHLNIVQEVDENFSCFVSMESSVPPQTSSQNMSVHFIQFEEFNPEKRSITKISGGSDSIKSSEISRQQIKDISHSRFVATQSDQYLNEPPGPSNRNALIRFKFPSAPSRFKKHLQIVIPEIEATQSSYEQTLIKQQQKGDTDLARFQALQEEILQLKARHAKQVRKLNEQMNEQRKNNELELADLRQKLQTVVNHNENLESKVAKLESENQTLMMRMSQHSKSVDPLEYNDKLQYLINKLQKKSEENSQYQFLISKLQNQRQIEQIQNHYYLESRKELSLDRFEDVTNAYKISCSEQVSMQAQAQLSKSDLQQTKNCSQSHIFKEDINTIKRFNSAIGSSEVLLNKIKQKKTTDPIPTMPAKHKSYTNILFPDRAQKIFSIQTSPQTKKLQTEKSPQEAPKIQSTTKQQDQFRRTNFFYLQRKGSDGVKEEPVKFQTPSMKPGFMNLMTSHRKAATSNLLSKAVYSLQTNIHQRQTSRKSTDYKRDHHGSKTSLHEHF